MQHLRREVEPLEDFVGEEVRCLHQNAVIDLDRARLIQKIEALQHQRHCRRDESLNRHRSGRVLFHHHAEVDGTADALLDRGFAFRERCEATIRPFVESRLHPGDDDFHVIDTVLRRERRFDLLLGRL